MKLSKVLLIAVLLVSFVACNKPAGELIGASDAKAFPEANPHGMIFIRKGAFMMGENSQSALSTQADNNLKVTVDAFWMDETEVTNNEYRQFVNWVRDSIALRHLIGADPDSEYAIKNKNHDEESDRYEDDDTLHIRIDWKKWNKKVPFEKRFTDSEFREKVSPLFYEKGYGDLNTNALHYRYSWANIDQAALLKNKFDVTRGRYADNVTIRVDSFWVDKETNEIFSKTINRPLREPKDINTNAIICVYPDTLVWARDFDFAFNDPYVKRYFNTPAYAEYPVVGVTWEQAFAFCRWRTDYLASQGGQRGKHIHDYRLPTEAEWEYAARGGRPLAKYPWGDQYARQADGCFLANFKPYRGTYHSDTGIATITVGEFEPNDFGLMDMAGNVAEWTMSSYSSKSNVSVHDLNPEFPYMARKDDPDVLKRKVVKGGSWKDVSYYLQNGVRTYEYQYESRSYIGFRCVRSYMGDQR
jgi:gliding motility-associated lipoprotein GldK